MDNNEPLAWRTRVNKYGIWLLSSVMLITTNFAQTAQAKDKGKQATRAIRSQIKKMRLLAEIQGDDFVPTVEMATAAPDVVKAEMQKFENDSKELKQMQSRVKSAQYQVKIFKSLYNKKAASKGEFRRKIHTYNALKARLLDMKTKILNKLEQELVNEAKANDKDEWVIKVQLARIEAEINDKPFKPTKEMQENAAEIVKVEQQLYDIHHEHLAVIDSRLDIAEDEVKLSKSAFGSGFISKSEYLQSEHDYNKLLNANLKLQCNIMNESEQIKIENASSDKSEWGQKVRLARIKAHLNDTDFTPTSEMEQNVPNLVALEKELYECNKQRFDLLKKREQMLQERYNIAKAAFNTGVTAKKEMLTTKRQLNNFQNYRAKLNAHFERESNMVLANLESM